MTMTEDSATSKRPDKPYDGFSRLPLPPLFWKLGSLDKCIFPQFLLEHTARDWVCPK
jgi:hypothetical protein